MNQKSDFEKWRGKAEKEWAKKNNAPQPPHDLFSYRLVKENFESAGFNVLSDREMADEFCSLLHCFVNVYRFGEKRISFEESDKFVEGFMKRWKKERRRE